MSPMRKAKDIPGHVWCQTCKDWFKVTEGGHRLDHWLDHKLAERLQSSEPVRR